MINKESTPEITLIVLDNTLYMPNDYVAAIAPDPSEYFTQTLLAGLGIGVNLVGMRLVFIQIADECENENHIN